jgi:hypothetical protein
MDRARRDVAEILGNQYLCTTSHGGGQHLAVFRVVGHVSDELFVPGHGRARKVHV